MWRELLRRPEAVPASWGATPPVAAETTGPRQSPKPTLATIDGPRTSEANVPSAQIRPNYEGKMPWPGVSTRRGSNRALARKNLG